MPERLLPTAKLPSAPFPGKLQNLAPLHDVELKAKADISSSASAYFEIEGESFIVIANFCEGRNCLVDDSVKFTSARFDIGSSVYLSLIHI